jgi:hypothetical protein
LENRNQGTGKPFSFPHGPPKGCHARKKAALRGAAVAPWLSGSPNPCLLFAGKVMMLSQGDAVKRASLGNTGESV